MTTPRGRMNRAARRPRASPEGNHEAQPRRRCGSGPQSEIEAVLLDAAREGETTAEQWIINAELATAEVAKERDALRAQVEELERENLALKIVPPHVHSFSWSSSNADPASPPPMDTRCVCGVPYAALAPRQE